MQPKLIVTVSLLFVAILASVGLIPIVWSIHVQQQRPSDYFPLAIGNRWTYVVSSGTQNVELNAVIDAKENVSDVQCYVRALLIQQGNQRECSRGPTTVSTSTRQRWTIKSTSITLPPLILDSPLETGHKWTSQNEVIGENGNTVMATETFEVVGPTQIDVPAGTFDTIEIKITHTDGGVLTGTRWYALGVGLVEEVGTQQGVTTTVELKSFQLSNVLSTSSSRNLAAITTSQELMPTQTQYANSLSTLALIGPAAIGSFAIVAYLLRRRSKFHHAFSMRGC